MMPVSCCGKNPLGITMYSATVAATVSRNTISVARCCVEHEIEAARV